MNCIKNWKDWTLLSKGLIKLTQQIKNRIDRWCCDRSQYNPHLFSYTFFVRTSRKECSHLWSEFECRMKRNRVAWCFIKPISFERCKAKYRINCIRVVCKRQLFHGQIMKYTRLLDVFVVLCAILVEEGREYFLESLE